MAQARGDGVEYWTARELAEVLGYARWENFQTAIKRAMKACEGSNQEISDHFREVTKMVTLGSGATREVEDWQLSRYACYLIVQNADPDKPIVALGQTYFATQTRAAEATQEQERIYLRDQTTERNKSLAAGAYEVGVVSARDFAIFTDHSYMGLYNGEKAADIHARTGPKKSQHILAWMEAEELAANFFRATQADAKIRREGASGKDEANEIHREAGRIVRCAIAELGGTVREELPTPAESIQQLRRREAKRLQSGPSPWDQAGEEARCLRSG